MWVVIIVGTLAQYWQVSNCDVTYEVIMQKFRASVEPFWDLKIGKYVETEYETPVSSEYIISCVLLSLTSSDGRSSRVLLADVIRWIYNIYSTHHEQCATGNCTALSSFSQWLKLQLFNNCKKVIMKNLDYIPSPSWKVLHRATVRCHNSN